MSSKSDLNSGHVYYGGSGEKQVLIDQQSNSASNLDSNRVPMTAAQLSNSKSDVFMQDFLEVARNGNAEKLGELIQLGNTGKNLNDEPVKFDINYRGKSKRNYGWTALHIGCYFNLVDVVKLLISQPTCDVNVCNYENDTPLHKACLTSRYEIIEILLMKNADINIKNNEGMKPKDLATDQAVKKLMQAAEKTENHNLQKELFEAVTNNDLDLINKLFKNKNFDLNSYTDTFGNTALHIASNRNRCEVAALLMQRGIDTVVRNQNKLTALDLAKTKEMKEILGYMPYNWRKYEGVLLKKRKFLGFKEYYVVLNKGSIIYYLNKKDALKDVNRKGTYFLNNAFIGDYPTNNSAENPEYSWTINFTNGRKHTLCSALDQKRKTRHAARDGLHASRPQSSKRTHLNPADRKKKWIHAMNEHIRLSESQVESRDNENKQLMPMESLQKNLNILKCDEDKLTFLLIQIEQQIGAVKLSDLNQLPPQSSLSSVFLNYKKNFDNLNTQIKTLIDNTNKCLSLHEQRESLLKSQLNDTRIRCELLEQSLRVLAQENLDIEVKPQSSDVGTEGRDSTEEDIVEPVDDDDSDDGSEEFFDIEEDVSEESDNKSNDFKSTENVQMSSNIAMTKDIVDSMKGVKVHSNSDVSQSLIQSQRDSIVSQNPRSAIETDAAGWRLRLPTPMIDRSQISIWSILKSNIGKDLSKITLPAAWCEPLSFLERAAENFYYSSIVNKAIDAQSPLERMQQVATYVVTNISSNIGRLSKPFNPLLGETYELTREDLGFKLLCEQVSHHPPISAFHVSSTDSERRWKSYGDINAKTKFWGKSIEVYPKGTLTLDLENHNETYTWNSVTCCVHNIIVGRLWFEYYGTMEIVCHQTGYKAVLNFKPYSWSNKELHKFDGYIYDNKKRKLSALYGFWSHCVYSCDVDAFEAYVKSGKTLPTLEVDEFFNEKIDKNNTSKLADNMRLLNAKELWRADSRPSYTNEYYSFNYFTMSINEMRPEFEKILAPTDCRFRTDIKALEMGDLELAGAEKCRLEEAQRERRKTTTEPYTGKWFKLKKHPFVKDDTWQFTNQYWNRQYDDCLQLY